MSTRHGTTILLLVKIAQKGIAISKLLFRRTIDEEYKMKNIKYFANKSMGIVPQPVLYIGANAMYSKAH